jgi:2-phosphosulfolactate phosphatase
LAASSVHSQSEFTIRCEWGLAGLKALAPSSDVIIIMDVLSFCTCVDIAVEREAHVYPYAEPEGVEEYARLHSAALAIRERGAPGYSLSPASLLAIPAGTRLVLPSPNGSSLTVAAYQANPGAAIFAGCLRNASTAAAAAQKIGERIAVIPAGERWREDWSLRPAWEDWVGAGAIIAALEGLRSPKARSAQAAFEAAQGALHLMLKQCSSGKELIEAGFAQDVTLAGEYNASRCVPRYTPPFYSSTGG